MNRFRSSPLWNRLRLVLIVLLGFALRLHRLNAHSLWLDEQYSARFVLAPVADMVVSLIQDKVHPPLYYFGLAAWVQLGHTEFLLRLFSVFWGVLTIPVLFGMGRLLWGSVAGLTAAFLLAVSPFHVWYSQEARMHTLLVFAVSLSGWFLLRLVGEDTRRNWLGYVAGMITAVYTHYFALLVLVSQGLVLALYRKRYQSLWHTFLRRAVLIVILLAAWVLLVLLLGDVAHGRSHLSWIPAVHWYEPILTLVVFSAGSALEPSQPVNYVIPIIFTAALLSPLLVGLKQRWGDEAVWRHFLPQEMRFGLDFLWIWLLFPLFVTWLVSLDFFPWLNLSLYMDRNLIVVLPALLLLVSWGLVFLTRKRPFSLFIILGIIAMMSLLPLQRMYNNPAYYREDWRAAFEKIAEVVPDDDVLLLQPLAQLGWWYYGQNRPYVPIVDNFASQLLQIQKEADTVWLISSATVVNPHGFPQERNAAIAKAAQNDPVAAQLGRRYDVQAEYYFSGIRLAQYELR